MGALMTFKYTDVACVLRNLEAIMSEEANHARRAVSRLPR